MPKDKIRIEGLLHCCIETVDSLYPDGPAQAGTEGQVLQCKYQPDDPGHRMIFTGGTWQWLRN
jgi:hypothetical protein